jgi:8-oxo-dGTP diphosphatase
MERLMPKRTYIYGGAFDPPTLAHCEIVKTIRTKLRRDDELIILVSDNDEKQYVTPIEQRIAMAELAFVDGTREDRIQYIRQPHRMYQTITEDLGLNLDKDDVILCLGADQAIQLRDGKWHHSDELITKCRFMLFNRSHGEIPMYFMTQGIADTVVVLPGNLCEVSSTACRNIMEKFPNAAVSMNELAIRDYVKNYIADMGLYHQNSRSYEANFEEFIKKYKIEKINHKWPEPSVTADILAYNWSEEVLLIRRKNYPFKNYWALPGGFFDLSDPDIDATAARELREETSLDVSRSRLKQIKTYAHMFDPRLRIVDVAFSIVINEDEEQKIKAADDAADFKWWPLNNLPVLAFHHKQIIEDFLRSNDNPFKR